jgi:hypothetical protein
MPSPPVVAFGGGGKSSQVTGRGASTGADAGRWRGTCGLHSTVQSQADPYRWPARGSKLKRPTSRQNGRSTPARHLPERERHAGGIAHRSHSVGAIFAEPWPSCERGVCLDGCPASQRPFHTFSQLGGQWEAQYGCSASADPAAPSTQRRARLRSVCVSTAAIYPVGPSDTHSSVLPSAICHSQRNSLLPISITSCFGMADTVKHP